MVHVLRPRLRVQLFVQVIDLRLIIQGFLSKQQEGLWHENKVPRILSGRFSGHNYFQSLQEIIYICMDVIIFVYMYVYKSVHVHVSVICTHV